MFSRRSPTIALPFLPILLLLLFFSSPALSLRDSFLSSGNGEERGYQSILLPRGLPLFKEAPAFRNGAECVQSGQTQGFCDDLSVHIAMTLDVPYIRGSMAAILSIVQHASCPENVVFHFLATSQMQILAERIRSTFPYLRFQVYEFDEKLVIDRISPSIRQALEQPLNYARIHIAGLLPSCVNRVIYLDSDVVVVDDIMKLWGKSLNDHPLAAPEYCHANFTAYFTDAFWQDRLLSTQTFAGRRTPCYFNTGVMVMDLAKWRLEGYTERIEEWMRVQKAEKRIYELGSLPPFLLVFAGDVEPVEHRWNQHGLGGDNVQGNCRGLHDGPVSLLHWSGKGKPWDRLDTGNPCPLDGLWAPYDLFLSSFTSEL